MPRNDQRQPTLLDWLALRQTFDWLNARPLGGFLGFLGVLFSSLLVIAACWTLILFFVALVSDDPNGEGIRNIGLVLVALLGGPFLVWRSYVAAQQANTAVEALLNDKINAAATDLAARRQVTRVVEQDGKEVVLTEWEDDIVTRVAAIDRLQGLANERPDIASRIARQLSIFAREVSMGYPAEQAPATLGRQTLAEWSNTLVVKRRDIEKAVQTLGKLSDVRGASLTPGDIDLRDINMQAFDLQGLSFPAVAFQNCALDGAVLSSTDLHNSQFYNCFGANLKMNYAITSGFQIVGKPSARFIDCNFSARRKKTNAETHLEIYQGVHFVRCNFGAAFSARQIDSSQFEDCSFVFAGISGNTKVSRCIFSGSVPHIQSETTLDACALRRVNFTAPLLFANDVAAWSHHLASCFADASVILPEGVQRPSFWPTSTLMDNDFENAWREWQKPEQ
ncbi:hypothetical protein [Yoonia sp.]|uniref:hypothetical protein n=1 Tax=Yoonia sp. TaxID=2212373 RepID=UPI00391A9646